MTPTYKPKPTTHTAAAQDHQRRVQQAAIRHLYSFPPEMDDDAPRHFVSWVDLIGSK